ncbi:unnamed protein product [Linum tenue]|uniref:Uncharacterized protein n=1 Tax=Linum tenue TaxID=586396 RepID=A0AAV0H8T4_9ROSI|nr:unnamed protein product [Linum tenue]
MAEWPSSLMFWSFTPSQKPNLVGSSLFFSSCSKSPREFAEGLAKEAHCYNGFNLILSDISLNTMVYDVSPGLHVLSNAKLDSPWPKAQKLGQGFKEQLVKYGEGEVRVKEIAKKLGWCGTRSTIALTVRRNAEVCFDETYLEDGTWKEKTFYYQIQNKKLRQLNK